jgi:GNAT superfamily N-acetyltransferase
MGDPGVYARNAAAMWASLAPWSRVLPGAPAGLSIIEIPAQPTTRVVLNQPIESDPGHIGALLALPAERGRVVVEDPFGVLRLPTGADVKVDRMPVMLRAAGPVAPLATRSGIRVVQVLDRRSLERAEQVIIDGFPQPYRPGQVLVPLVLSTPGWRIWLAYRDGEPAAACCTYDDGAALGVYWLATLPRHRSRGLGRDVMTAALAACARRPTALVATAAGEHLYSSLGFQPVATAAWYRRPGLRRSCS